MYDKSDEGGKTSQSFVLKSRRPWNSSRIPVIILTGIAFSQSSRLRLLTFTIIKGKKEEKVKLRCVHAIWSYNERWDFPRAGSSIFLPKFSGLTFLRFLGPFFIFSEIFASGVLYFLRWFFIFFQLLNEMKGTNIWIIKKILAALDLYVFFDSNTF